MNYCYQGGKESRRAYDDLVSPKKKKNEKGETRNKQRDMETVRKKLTNKDKKEKQ